MFKLKALWASIAAFFTVQTVDRLVADVETRVEHLTLVADTKAAEQKVHDKAIEEYQKLKDAAAREEARARAIAGKFKALLSEV